MSETVAIIGGGQAAAQAIASLRQQGFDGGIVLVSGEAELPYQRPPLSKAFLAGELERARLLIKPAEFYKQAEVDARLGVRATGLDVAQRQLQLDDGQSLSYDHLVFATGGRPRPLQCPGADHPALHYLRTLADVDAIRERFRPDARMVVIGGGYIGLEVTAIAVKHGLQVTVIEAAPIVLGRVTCPEVAKFYTALHREAGVDIQCDTGVDRIEDEAGVAVVVTTSGERFPADLIIAGIGLLPNVELAESAGLDCDNGIVVDEYCRASVSGADVPGIYSIGDCANHPSAIYQTHLRLESVHNAIEQGKTVAATICGKLKAYDQVPWFWSDQYDIKLQTVGISRGYDAIAVRGDPESKSFAVFYFREKRLIAVDAINRPAEFILARQLIPRQVEISPQRLSDDTISVKELAA